MADRTFYTLQDLKRFYEFIGEFVGWECEEFTQLSGCLLEVGEDGVDAGSGDGWVHFIGACVCDTCSV